MTGPHRTENEWAKDQTEIERLRTAVLNGCERPCVIESEITQIARADERRRTAEKIASLVDGVRDKFGSELPFAWTQGMNAAGIIAREVGGSDDQRFTQQVGESQASIDSAEGPR